MGGGLAFDPPRRRRLSLHEHHAVQPAIVCGVLSPAPMRGCFPGFIDILLWIFATPAVVILGGPFLRETWLEGARGRLTSSALIVLGVGAAYIYSAFAVIEGNAAGLFRYCHHGADAVHAWPLSGGGRTGPGGARSRAAVGGRTRKRRRGGEWDGDSPPGARGRCRHAGTGAAGRTHSRSTASSSREHPTPMKR